LLPALDQRHPVVDAQRLLRLVVLEEVTVLAAQVAPFGDVDRPERVSRQAEETESDLGKIEQ